MNYLNAKLFKKAYLIEFYENSILREAFTFSVPPQSEEFSYPQRIKETKTFGGSVISDYGNDTVKITLSGNTINQHVKLIYRELLGFKFKTGEAEVLYLRDILKNYGMRYKLNSNKEIYLYSLDYSITTGSSKWWKVYIENYEISRNKDMPFTFNYKISFLADPEAIGKTNKIVSLLNISSIASIESWITNIQEAVFASIEFLSIGMEYINEAAQLISTLTKAVETFGDVIQSYVNLAKGYLEAVSNVIEETTNLGDTVLSTALRYTVGLGSDVYNAAADVSEAAANLVSWVTNSGEEAISLTTDLLNEYSTTTDKIVDTWTNVSLEIQNKSNEMVAVTKKTLDTIGIAVNPGSDGEDDNLLITYGYVTKTVTDGDTWDSLAKDYLGDVSYSQMLALYNKSTTDSDLTAGTKIYIPVLSKTDNTSDDNEVYNSVDVKDSYGCDISISSNGDFALDNGDIESISGADNLNQSILNRLNTGLNSRVRDEVYGIRNTAGTTTEETINFITASIEQTILADPRVKTVDSLTWSGTGESLYIEVEYTDINDIQQTLKGSV